jgi:hypothetical protein
MDRDEQSIERNLTDALRRLNAATVVPPADSAREAALMAAFDAIHARPAAPPRRDYWYMAGFAAAAAVLIALALPADRTGRHPYPSGGIQAAHEPPSARRGVQLEPPNEFVIVPGAANLPRMESGTLVRMDVPVSMLPSLGVTPPQELQLRLVTSRASVVTADFIIAQDGLPRAVRLVN